MVFFFLPLKCYIYSLVNFFECLIFIFSKVLSSKSTFFFAYIKVVFSIKLFLSFLVIKILENFEFRHHNIYPFTPSANLKNIHFLTLSSSLPSSFTHVSKNKTRKKKYQICTFSKGTRSYLFRNPIINRNC